MEDAVNAAFASWTIPPWATFALILSAAIYIRGWRQIRRTRPEQFPPWRLLSFLTGLLIVWLAIASPLDALSGMLLSVHMTQHLLLMSIAPPLVALSAPMVPMLRGLPRFWVREGLGPFFTLGPVHALERLLKSRLFAWVAMNVTFLAWHLPAAYDLALAHPELHEVEHACFFLTSLLFWWPIIEPWPVVYKGSRWLMLPYLMSADMINTGLSAFLSFSGRVVYPVYADAPRLFGITALSDQVTAGSLMWVLGSTTYLVPVMWITLRQVSRRGERRQAARVSRSRALREQAELNRMYTLEAPSQTTYATIGGSGAVATATRVAQASRASRRTASPPARGFDLFSLPAVAWFFKSRYGRQSLQAVMLLASAAIIVDGLFGHQMSSMNLAGIVPWTYARALFVLALLLIGNLFCMSCPFMLPRELAKKIAGSLGLARLPWPRALRNKWLSLTLLGVFFWAYEALALWNSPLRTAFVLLAYFLTALVLDSIYRGASFCKYVCPLGQFNFVSSLLSPTSLAARSQAVCTSCSTRDCISGTKDQSGHQKQRGCELDLFMPEKQGNLDCTLCMDCVKACPHDNIGLFVTAPAQELVQIAAWDPQRSSVGRYSRRTDLAALALVIISAAFASAAVMVTPVASLLERVSAALPGWLVSGAGGAASGLLLAASAPASLFCLLLGAVLLMRSLGASAGASRSGTQDSGARNFGPGDASFRAQVCRWTLGLLPIGLGMWAAHLSFHLVTAAGTLAPAVQALQDLPLRRLAAGGHSGGAGHGMLAFAASRSLLAPDALLQLQLAMLDAGLLGALYLGWRLLRPSAVAGRSRSSSPHEVPAPASPTPSLGRSLVTLAPWATVVLLLYAAGVWVLLEPMQMRGMMGM